MQNSVACSKMFLNTMAGAAAIFLFSHERSGIGEMEKEHFVIAPTYYSRGSPFTPWPVCKLGSLERNGRRGFLRFPAVLRSAVLLRKQFKCR